MFEIKYPTQIYWSYCRECLRKGVDWIEVFTIKGGDYSHFPGNLCNHFTRNSGRYSHGFAAHALSPKP